MGPPSSGGINVLQMLNMIEISGILNGKKELDKESIYYLDAQNSLARHYLFNNTYEEAENKIKSMVGNNNNNYSLKKTLGDFYRYNKKYDLALDVYDDMIKENQDDLWNIFYMRGICYEQKDEWDLAEKDLKTIKDKYNEIINNSSGKVIKIEEWGLINLANKIKNYKKGFYI